MLILARYTLIYYPNLSLLFSWNKDRYIDKSTLTINRLYFQSSELAVHYFKSKQFGLA